MNSPLGKRKVRLRGLGGQAVCGVPRICASATGDYRIRRAMGINRPTWDRPGYGFRAHPRRTNPCLHSTPVGAGRHRVFPAAISIARIGNPPWVFVSVRTLDAPTPAFTPHPSAQADIASSQPRFQSPGPMPADGSRFRVILDAPTLPLLHTRRRRPTSRFPSRDFNRPGQSPEPSAGRSERLLRPPGAVPADARGCSSPPVAL
jgi:hypothetical protein